MLNVVFFQDDISFNLDRESDKLEDVVIYFQQDIWYTNSVSNQYTDE